MIQQIENYEDVMRCCSGDYTERLPNHLLSVGCLPIDVPRDDSFFSIYNMTCMEFLRGVAIFPKNCELGHIEQVLHIRIFGTNVLQIESVIKCRSSRLRNCLDNTK